MVDETNQEEMEQELGTPDEDQLMALRENALKQISDPVRLLLKEHQLDKQGDLALALVELNLHKSADELAKDIYRRSVYGTDDDEYFKSALDGAVTDLLPTLELRGMLGDQGIDVTKLEKLLDVAQTVGAFQGMKWEGITNSFDPSTSKIDKEKLTEVWTGKIGPDDTGVFVPNIRGDFVSSGIDLDVVDYFEEQCNKKSIADISDDNLEDFQEWAVSSKHLDKSTAKKISNKIKSAIGAAKDTYHRSTESQSESSQRKQQDVAERQAITDAAIRESEERSRYVREASLELLKQVDTKDLAGEGAEKVKEGLKNMIDFVQTDLAVGEGFQGRQALLSSLTQDAMNFSTGASSGVIQSYPSNEDLVASASGGIALHGISLLIDDFPILASSLPSIKRPEYVSMYGTTQSFTASTFKTTSESQMSRFHKTSEAGGMTMAERSTKSWGVSASVSGWGASVSGSHGESNSSSSANAKEEQKQLQMQADSMVSSAHIVEYIKMPMRSFRIPYDAMRLSREVQHDILKVGTERKALEFLRRYGSHLPFGMHTLGGVFSRSISLTTKTAKSSVEMMQAAGNTMSQEKAKSASSSASGGGTYMGVTVSASASMSNASGSGSTSFSNNAKGDGSGMAKSDSFFNSWVVCMGPNAATPEAFYDMLTHNTGTWAIIERGNLDQLRPIWELIKEEMLDPNDKSLEESKRRVIKKAIRCLKRAWLKSVYVWQFNANPVILPTLVMRSLQDAIAERKAMISMIKSICAVVAPQPGHGNRLEMLTCLGEVLRMAVDEELHIDAFEGAHNGLRALLAHANDKPRVFKFSVRSTEDGWTNHLEVVRQAHISASIANADMGPDSWEDLADEFAEMARWNELPFFQGSDKHERTAVIQVKIHWDDSEPCLDTEMGSVYLDKGQSNLLLCPDARTPVRILRASTNRSREDANPIMGLYIFPGNHYVWISDQTKIEGVSMWQDQILSEYQFCSQMRGFIIQNLTKNDVSILLEAPDTNELLFEFCVPAESVVFQPESQSRILYVQWQGIQANQRASCLEQRFDVGKKYYVCADYKDSLYQKLPEVWTEEELNYFGGVAKCRPSFLLRIMEEEYQHRYIGELPGTAKNRQTKQCILAITITERDPDFHPNAQTKDGNCVMLETWDGRCLRATGQDAPNGFELAASVDSPDKNSKWITWREGDMHRIFMNCGEGTSHRTKLISPKSGRSQRRPQNLPSPQPMAFVN